jgi:hypothetical protein
MEERVGGTGVERWGKHDACVRVRWAAVCGRTTEGMAREQERLAIEIMISERECV